MLPEDGEPVTDIPTTISTAPRPVMSSTHSVRTTAGPDLRYVDGLPVREVADHLDRTVHATEALLVRARRAFSAAAYEGGDTP